jgi:hypothetical protein
LHAPIVTNHQVEVQVSHEDCRWIKTKREHERRAARRAQAVPPPAHGATTRSQPMPAPRERADERPAAETPTGR